MADSKQVPKMRFSGFDGSWIKRNLGFDVADIVGGGTPSTQNPEYWNGDIDWYSPTEIGNAVYACDSVKKITDLGLKHSSAQLLPANKTILFTSRAGIGDMAILQHPGATNQGFQSLILKEGYDTYFVYSMGFLIKKFAEKYSSGSTFLEISGKKLGMMEASIPSEQEQTKIGELFKNLDTLINQHQTRVAQLANVKKFMLDKMFPKAGADIPEIRYSGFESGWIHMSIDELATNGFSNGVFNDPEKVGTGYLLINVKDMYVQSCIDPTTLERVNIDSLEFEKNKVLYGDVFFTRSSIVKEGIAYSNVFLKYDADVTFDGHLIRMRPDLQKVAPDFLYYIFKTGAVRKQFIERGKTATMTTIGQLDIAQVRINIPVLNEQQKIGQFFQNLDTLIAQNQKALDQLKNLKQALLHKMFV